MLTRLKLAGVQQHHAAPNVREGVLKFKIVKHRTFGNNVFQQGSQVRNIPLTVAKFVDQSPLGLSRRHVKRLIKSSICTLHPQRGVQNQQWFTHCIDNVLRVILNVINQRI